MRNAKTMDNSDEQPEQVSVLIIPATSLTAALAHASNYLQGREHDADGSRRVTIGLYWHEGEFYAHVHVETDLPSDPNDGWTEDGEYDGAYEGDEMFTTISAGTMSGDTLTTSLIADAMASAFDELTEEEMKKPNA